MALAGGTTAYAADLGPFPGGDTRGTRIPIDYGEQTVGTTKTVTVDLAIDAGYTVTSVVAPGGPYVPDFSTVNSTFTVDRGDCVDAAGPSVCTLRVSFTPRTTQSFYMTHEIISCAGPGTFCHDWTLVLSGTGVVDDVSPFSQPVDNLPTLNMAKAGSTIPLKFRVTDAHGTPVSNLAAADVEVTSTPGGEGCASDAGEDSIETYVASSGLHNLGDGAYQYNWATPKTYKNQCRTMTVTVGGGTRSAAFQFK